MGELNLILHSNIKKRTYDISWTIEEFPAIMQEFPANQAIEKTLSAVLPGASEPTEISVVCTPKTMQGFPFFEKRYIKLEVSIGSGDCPVPLPSVKVGQLVSDGSSRVSWEPVRRDGNLYYCFKPHSELLAKKEQLLPGRRLTLHIKFIFCLSPQLISTTVETTQNRGSSSSQMTSTTANPDDQSGSNSQMISTTAHPDGQSDSSSSQVTSTTAHPDDQSGSSSSRSKMTGSLLGISADTWLAMGLAGLAVHWLNSNFAPVFQLIFPVIFMFLCFYLTVHNITV
jgi:hypothetical protein